MARGPPTPSFSFFRFLIKPPPARLPAGQLLPRAALRQLGVRLGQDREGLGGPLLEGGAAGLDLGEGHAPVGQKRVPPFDLNRQPRPTPAGSAR